MIKDMKELVNALVSEMRQRFPFMEVIPSMVEEFWKKYESMDTDWCFDYITSKYGDIIEVEY